MVDITKPEGEVVNTSSTSRRKFSVLPPLLEGRIYFRSDTRLWKFGKS